MALEENFQKAVEYARDPTKGGAWGMSSDQKLAIYGCYKQVTEGPCQGERPSMFSIQARSKYDAWVAAGSLSKEEAMKKYISIIAEYAPDVAI